MGQLLTEAEMQEMNELKLNGEGYLALLAQREKEGSETETALIAAVVRDPARLTNIQQQGILPRHFGGGATRTIFDAILSLQRDGVPVDTVTIQARLKRNQHNGQTAYEFVGAHNLTRIISAECIAENAEHYAKIVIEQARRRKLGNLATEIQRQVTGNQKAEDIEGMLESYVETARKESQPKEGPKSVSSIIEMYAELRPAIMEGLFRIGETMNVVAPTKRGKSWLVTGLALCIVTGRRWLGMFQCVKGRVLILDNELHVETSAHRVPRVAHAMGIGLGEYGDDLLIDNLRGKEMDVEKLGAYLEQFQPGYFSVIVIDALYRFLPPGWKENENQDMTRVYNLLDEYARRWECAFIVITHSSKGSQADKAVTDIGSGAGAQSRAPDTHVVLRQHEDPDAVVLDLAARSWPPLDKPIVLRWDWPVWFVDHELDPAALHRPGRQKKQEKKADPEWTAERFAAEFGKPTPQPVLAMVDAACAAGMSDRKANSLVKRAAAIGKFHKWPTQDAREVAYATVPAPPVSDAEPSKEPAPGKAKKPRKSKGKTAK